MTTPVELFPLCCIRCDTPVLAEPDEVAWTCAQCGQGLLLYKNQDLVPINIHYSPAIPANGKGRPFWVTIGRVTLSRQVYGGGAGKMPEAEQFWGAGRQFVIPAFTCPLDTLLSLATQFLNQSPALQEGPAARYAPVILSPDDAPALAEYIVMAVEASRKDNLKAAEISVYLEPPDLWVLP